jgi:uncharacterized membrane protein
LINLNAVVTIEAPAERVFELFTDFQWSPQHLHRAHKTEFHSQNKSGIGAEWTQYEEKENKPTVSRHKVTAFNAPSSFSMTSDDKAAFETMDFSFTQQDDGTLVSFDLTVAPKGFFKGLATKILKGEIHEMMQEDLERIKDAIEAELVGGEDDPE